MPESVLIPKPYSLFPYFCRFNPYLPFEFLFFNHLELSVEKEGLGWVNLYSLKCYQSTLKFIWNFSTNLKFWNLKPPRIFLNIRTQNAMRNLKFSHEF